jgi:ribosomal protein S10
MKLISQIKIKALNKNTLSLYKTFIKLVLNKINLNYTVIDLPIKIKKITLNKSPHVYKKAREQFQIITYKTTFNIISEIKPYLLRYLILNKPSFLKIKLIRKIV